MDSPSKYVFDHVLFKKDLASQLLCDICDNPILDAELARPCGHSFCGFCVEQIRVNGRAATCQMCGANVTGFCMNLLANQVLEREEGECKHCKAKFALDTAKHHVRLCDEVPVDCNFCSQPVKRRDRGRHMEICPCRDVVCACGEKMKKKDQENHVSTTCEYKEEPCPLKCGERVKRFLLPSHTLECPAVVQYCAIKGCGEIVLRGSEKDHIMENLPRHYNLLKEDREAILWKAGSAAWFTVEQKKTGEIGTFCWTIPTACNTAQVYCSPQMEKWLRKWRLFCAKRGGSIEFGLEYSQGVSPIHLCISFIVEHRQQSCHVTNISAVSLKEGEMVKSSMTGGMPQKIIIKMERVEPDSQ